MVVKWTGSSGQVDHVIHGFLSVDLQLEIAVLDEKRPAWAFYWLYAGIYGPLGWPARGVSGLLGAKREASNPAGLALKV
jgi:hypothetical protein